MQTPYIQQFEQTSEVRYIETADFDALYPQALTTALAYPYIDIPTPLPIYPDEDGKMFRLPYFGTDTRRTLADLSNSATAALNRVYEKEFVEAARLAEADGCIVIAVLTKPFYLKSERDNAMLTLEAELKELVGSEDIVVVFDLDIFRRIDDDMSEEEVLELYNIAKLRRERHTSKQTT